MTAPGSSASAARGGGADPRLFIGIAVGAVVGLAFGGILPAAGIAVEVVGDIFLNFLLALVVPLVMLSIIVGVTGLGDIRELGTLGWRTVAYYVMTTALSVSAGIVLVNIVQPGRGVSPGEEHPEASYRVGGPAHRTVTLLDGAWERTGYDDRYVVVLRDQDIRGTVDSVAGAIARVRLWERRERENVFYITAEGGTRLPFRRVEGELVSAEPEVADSGIGIAITLPVQTELEAAGEGGLGATLIALLVGDEETGKQGLIPRNIVEAMVRVEILPLIVFSILIAAALSVLGDRARPAISVLSGLNDGVMKLVHWIMWLAPVGIFGLIAARVGRAGGFSGFLPELQALGKYSLTVVVGLVVHAFVVLPLILRFLGRRSPPSYARGVGAALGSAFSTASSSATLPLTMEGVEQENGVSNRTASFVLPLGATINMDGTALYEAVAAIFIAQVYGVSLDPLAQVVVFVTATLAAIGAAGIPEAGLVTMVIVLTAVGLPVEGIGLLLAIDWLLDRCRTTVNVWGDSVGAAVIERFERRTEQDGNGREKTE